jgi:pyruvate, water dikinase
MSTLQPVQPALRFVRPFEDVGIDDIASVGGKNASLGEMYRALRPKGVNIPPGFAITASAYWHFLEETGVDERIERAVYGLDTGDLDDLRRRGSEIRHAIVAAELPQDLSDVIAEAYRDLCGDSDQPVDVAVRSSATAEDLPDASFAGQQETYLNVQGVEALLHTVKRCFASLFTDRAISYRADKGYDSRAIALSVGVQRMVRSDLAASGVMFTIDTESGFRDAILINAAYGLGENVVQGSVNPDEYCVFKPTLRAGFRPILQKTVGTKEFKLVYDVGGGRMVKNVPVAPDDRARCAVTDDDILTLARWGCLIEDHYSEKRGTLTPMDIEWAKDGRTGELFILQARPETVQARRDTSVIKAYRLKERGRVLVTGRSVGDAIAAGPVRVVKSVQFLDQVRDGDILVTDKTDPDWEPVMRRAAAIITNRGGRTCHAAIVSRELGVPAVVGTEHATDILRDGQRVTISCAEGDAGYVYEGVLPFDVSAIDLKGLGEPRTKVMMNVGNPQEAFALSFTPNQGVGLAREEFIISSFIKVHPLALLNYERLEDPAVKAEIGRITAGYADKPQFFVDKLAEGAAMIAAAFYPKDVILRLSDFKTNEYANLLGGERYEPREENPMIGFRGASRYYDPRYRDGFALECRAVRKVRDEMGLTNLKENGLELYVMCEIPSNVILAEEFADIFDGFSIGSNDLTQLILGVDRDSEIVAHVFDERNPAVKKMISNVIRVARSRGRKIGICGQAPSDYPEFAEFLVEQGIDSISLNPDTVLKTTATILEKERQLAGREAAPRVPP